MAEPLPRLSLYLLLRSTLRMWLWSLAACMVGALITHAWLGTRLRAHFDDALNFDRARWMAGPQIQALIADLPTSARSAQLPFLLADNLLAALTAVLVALSIGRLLLKAPTRFSEALALGHVFWLPLASALFEWGENLGFAWLLLAHPRSPTLVASVTSVLKTGHSLTALTSLSLLVLLAVLALLHRLRGGRRT